MNRFIVSLACILAAADAQESGHANATWISEKKEISNGEALRTAIRVKVDEGWHAYWQNPGQVGMPFKLETDFPEGWKAGEIQYPFPKRLSVSGLVSFCLEGEFFLPVMITPPSGFEGSPPALSATLSWLACNDDSCLPGTAKISVQAEEKPGMVAEAYSKLPELIPGSRLSVDEDGDQVSLSVTLPENADVDPAACEVFPITRNIVDPAAAIAFGKKPEAPDSWHALVAKDEYFPEKIGVIRILLVNADKRGFVVSSE